MEWKTEKEILNWNFVFFVAIGTASPLQQHVFAVSEVCDGPWSAVASSQRKLEISKSIEYTVASKTRQSTNCRLVYLLKVANKVQKRSTPSSSDDDHEHDDFSSRFVRLNGDGVHIVHH